MNRHSDGRPDALEGFKAWEGEELGPDLDLAPGWRGQFTMPSPYLHIAGAWGESTAIGKDRDQPGVHLRMVAGVVGTGPAYHVLDAVVDAQVAEEWANVLLEAARAARADLEARTEEDTVTLYFCEPCLLHGRVTVVEAPERPTEPCPHRGQEPGDCKRIGWELLSWACSQCSREGRTSTIRHPDLPTIECERGHRPEWVPTYDTEFILRRLNERRAG